MRMTMSFTLCDELQKQINIFDDVLIYEDVAADSVFVE